MSTVAVRRDPLVLRADPARVLAKLFLPGQEIMVNGISRADAIIDRVLRMSEDAVSQTLAAVVDSYQPRHHDIFAVFTHHCALVQHRVPAAKTLSRGRLLLIGAAFTQEYAVEAAALFNPSMVAHPDQSGMGAGELRFAMSVRAVGEGHISSIEFRTGVIDSAGVRVDDPGRHLATGQVSSAPTSRAFLRAALVGHPDAAAAEHLLSLLPELFTADELDGALASVQRDRLTRGSTDAVIEHVRWIAACHYRVSFPAGRPLAENIIVPTSADESRGVEDARFTRFVEDDGTVVFYATYTGFDGARVVPRVLRTTDFATFDFAQITGSAAKDKGMALFPRKVGGHYLMLSRWDRENISIASSADALVWSDRGALRHPSQPWELIQLGNCGPPLETADGWLVLTHGVGPVRTYSISAILLDLHDPTRVIGSLGAPLLTAAADERDGYVPNVVYSCGALIHQDTLVLPYGCSDSAIRFAYVDLPELLGRLRGTVAAR